MMKAIVEALKYCDNCEFGKLRNKCGKDFIGDSKCSFPDDFFKLKDELFNELLEADKHITNMDEPYSQELIELGKAVLKAFEEELVFYETLSRQEFRKTGIQEKPIIYCAQDLLAWCREQVTNNA